MFYQVVSSGAACLLNFTIHIVTTGQMNLATLDFKPAPSNSAH